LENREAGSTLKQQAVLFRTSHHCGPLEVELTRRNIPFVKFDAISDDHLWGLWTAQDPLHRLF
jgi:superfamily I DNA/RNA helicase